MPAPVPATEWEAEVAREREVFRVQAAIEAGVPPNGYVTDAVAELKVLRRALTDAREEVVRTAEDATAALEVARDLYTRYIAAEALVLKTGIDRARFDIQPRLAPAEMPGGSRDDGLRVRRLRAAGGRW